MTYRTYVVQGSRKSIIYLQTLAQNLEKKGGLSTYKCTRMRIILDEVRTSRPYRLDLGFEATVDSSSGLALTYHTETNLLTGK